MTNALNPNVPNSARRYNYWLGGKDHFSADRHSGDLIAKLFPAVRQAALANRDFLRRAVEFLATQGITQYLDIGCGLPTAENTHQIAQRTHPDARTVYVDNDPLVASHGRALLARPQRRGKTTFVEADLRQPATILADPALTATLDLHTPVGLLLVAVLHYLDDTKHPYTVVRHLLEALPAGSWLVVSHVSPDLLPDEVAEAAPELIATSGVPTTLRSWAQISDFFTGLDLAAPGIVPVQQWRTFGQDHLQFDSAIDIYGGAARKR